MSPSFENDGLRPDEFEGRVPLFPLPHVSLFPQVVQPFHIFEPRYRQMLQASLDGDQLIGMAVLRSGWEGAEDPIPLERAVCVARIVSHTPLPDGRSNILLLGLSRGRIIRELPQRELFREAEVELLEDVYVPDGADSRAVLQQRLVDRFRQLLPQFPASSQAQLDKVVSGVTSLGLLTDVIASSAPLPAPLSLGLLAQVDVDERARMLLKAMEPPPLSPYQWEFSDN